MKARVASRPTLAWGPRHPSPESHLLPRVQPLPLPQHWGGKLGCRKADSSSPNTRDGFNYLGAPSLTGCGNKTGSGRLGTSCHTVCASKGGNVVLPTNGLCSSCLSGPLSKGV